MSRLAFGLGIAFLVIALSAGVFGFVGVASLSLESVKIFFFGSIVLAVVAFVGGWYARLTQELD